MSYQFAGFFASCDVPPPCNLPPEAVYRQIESPFRGIGIRLPFLIGKSPSGDEVQNLARSLGLTNADRWLFLMYDCWGGSIDFVYAQGAGPSGSFGPIEESHWDLVEPAFLNVMAEFGISSNDALSFAPFERGYWGEA